ncbi:hypothetical protein BH23VER1_BH23VER1_31680 [soil metagenome]
MSKPLALAKDLTKETPRSPRESLGGYVVAARMLDKCRADIAGTKGEYHYSCPLDQLFFDFVEIDPDAFKEFVATGAADDAVAGYIKAHAKERPESAVILWNNGLRYRRISELPEDLQVFLEGYIADYVTPTGKIPYVWFDVYDIEEGRI